MEAYVRDLEPGKYCLFSEVLFSPTNLKIYRNNAMNAVQTCFSIILLDVSCEGPRRSP